MSAITREIIQPKKYYPFLNLIVDVDLLAKRYFQADIIGNRNSDFYLNNQLSEIGYFFTIKNIIFRNKLNVLIKIFLCNMITVISLLQAGYNRSKNNLKSKVFYLIKTHKKRHKNIKAKFKILIFGEIYVWIYTDSDRMGDKQFKSQHCPVIPNLRLSLPID